MYIVLVVDVAIVAGVVVVEVVVDVIVAVHGCVVSCPVTVLLEPLSIMAFRCAPGTVHPPHTTTVLIGSLPSIEYFHAIPNWCSRRVSRVGLQVVDSGPKAW